MNTTKNRIPLRLDCCFSGKHGVLNLTQGVPFPDQTLARGGSVRLADAKGNVYPTQSRCLATWGPDLKYVKWLLVDAQLPRPAQKDEQLFLEYGAGPDAPAPEYPVRVQREDRRIILNNGQLELTLRLNNPAFIADIRVKTDAGWHAVSAAGTGPSLYMLDQHGTRYDSCQAAPEPVITVEEEGAIRSSVCVKGYHATAQGLRFCPFVLRMHMFAGRPDIQVLHTFIFDQDPDLVELAAVGLRLPLKLGADQRACFAGAPEPHFAHNRPDSPKAWRQAQWIAESDQACRVEFDGRARGQGRPIAAWASLQGQQGAAAVVLRDAYQEYPKAIRLQPDVLDIQLWPESCGKTLALKTPWKEPPMRPRHEADLHRMLKENQTAGVNWKGFLGTADIPETAAEGDAQSMEQAWELTEKYLKGRLVSWGDTGLTKAFGLAKTHEFRLLFSAQRPDDAAMEAWARDVQIPPLAIPAPAYMCATGALRPLSARNARRCPEVEAELEHMVHALLLNPVEEQRLYGALDYGDFVNCHARMHGFLYRLAQRRGKVKFTDLAGWFNNESSDLGLTLWQYFFRNGTREYWRAAEAYSEHQEDVDMIHCDPTDPFAAGWSHYHSMLHWSGGPSPSHTNIQNRLLHYYLTGNQRAFDTARESAEACLRNQEPCGVYSNRQGELRREFTVPVAQLWMFYEATWEQKYLDCARRSLDLFVAAQDASGLWVRDVYTEGPRGDKLRLEGAPGPTAANGEVLALYDAYRITGDERYRRALLKAADYLISHRTDSPGKTLPYARKSTSLLYGEMYTAGALVAYAYALSGDKRYLQAIRATLDDLPADMNGWAEMRLRTPFQRALDVPQDAHAMLAVLDNPP